MTYDGNGHLAHTEQIQDIELSRLKPEGFLMSRVGELQAKCHNVGGLLFPVHDDRRMNEVGIVCHSRRQAS